MSKNVKRTKWSNKEDKKLGKMISEGMTYKVIAKKLNRTAAAIATRVNALRKSGVVIDGGRRGRPLKAPKQKSPAAVKVAEDVLKVTNKAKKSDFNKSSPKPLKLNEILGDSHAALKQMTRVVLYAEMLERQNAALTQRIADVEKALRR